MLRLLAGVNPWDYFRSDSISHFFNFFDWSILLTLKVMAIIAIFKLLRGTLSK